MVYGLWSMVDDPASRAPSGGRPQSRSRTGADITLVHSPGPAPAGPVCAEYISHMSVRGLESTL
eukprot:2560056-Pyramimonas_sp.AAC.2